MAHLPVKEIDNRVDLAPAIQLCVKRAYRHRRVALIMKLIITAGTVTILGLLRLWKPAAGESTWNAVILYLLLATAVVTSFTSALTYILDSEREAGRYETATRALRRLRDRYETEVEQNTNNATRLKHLELWAKNHVYKIEGLIADRRVFDVNFHFRLSNP